MHAPHEPPLDLVGGIYEAALQPSLWEDVLESVQRHLGGTCSVLFHRDLTVKGATLEVVRGLDASRMPAYHEYYITRDPNFGYRRNKTVGTVTASHQIISDAEYEECEYYRDFLRHHGVFYSAGALLARERQGVANFGVLRPRELGPYEEDELERIRALVPHLRRAVQITHELAGRDMERQTMLAMLERIPTGVLLLDAHARVVFLNRRAQVMLAAGDGLTMTPHGLSAIDAETQPVLERLIADAVATGAGRATHAGGALTVPAPKGGEPCEVLVTPLRTERVPIQVSRERICAAVFVQLRDTTPSLAPDVLRDLFGLTAAEARVAVALVQGRRPEEIAAAADTSRYTVRSQLSAIYDKVGVRRQAELVQRVLSSPAVLGDDGRTSRDDPGES